MLFAKVAIVTSFASAALAFVPGNFTRNADLLGQAFDKVHNAVTLVQTTSDEKTLTYANAIVWGLEDSRTAFNNFEHFMGDYKNFTLEADQATELQASVTTLSQKITDALSPLANLRGKISAVGGPRMLQAIRIQLNDTNVLVNRQFPNDFAAWFPTFDLSAIWKPAHDATQDAYFHY